ncbi:hypothetical protein LSAT2_027381 [Lamellibrachia satsuma]|nr:hypothetical protein LSAT2_027381 [Lamellibrachia satsuma]
MRNSTQLFQLFVEMQRRTEERMGVQHTRGEEGRIDGIYEADIALTTWQASQIVQDLSKRPKRKLAEPLAKRWALPIPYIFDGTHSEYDTLCNICNKRLEAESFNMTGNVM